MSHFPPEPPPPSTDNKHVQQKTNVPRNCMTPTKTQIDECLWALDYPELQRACYLARVCQLHAPQKCVYHNVASILQEGPTCGLTALSMLLSGKPTPKELLALAKDLHYTNNGEMFSAHNLFQLICDHLQLATSTDNDRNANISLECHMHEGRLNCAKVRDCLRLGACIFVPYDPDFNHAPCLKYGHKAHWALIIGYLISDTGEFYVLARHGKAKNLAVWSLNALSDSNSNLIEFAQPKGYPGCDFLLPIGGIGGDKGLRERAIIVNGLTHETLSVR